MKNIFRKIAGVNLEFRIENEFTKIAQLVSCFEKGHPSRRIEGVINIRKADKRKVIVSDDFSELVVQGMDIDNIYNPFNIIGILQAIFRYVGTKSSKNNIFLLHGSCSFAGDEAVFFGDDGTSTAKTLASIECALISKKYVGDEFCFYDAKDKSIFSYDFIPIHFRDCVKEYLTKEYQFKLPESCYEHSVAGDFVPPFNLFKIVKKPKLHSIYFVHFGENIKSSLLTGEETIKSLEICLTSHIMKLLNPSLDRIQFSQEEDSCKENKYDGRKISELLEQLSIYEGVKKMAELPAYKISLVSPNQITKAVTGFVSKEIK